MAFKWQLKKILHRLKVWGPLDRLRGIFNYEPHEKDYLFFRKLPGGLFLDIGANAGQSALTIARENPRVRILSLEPNPAMRHSLERVKRNLGKRYEFLLLGVGAKKGKLKFFVPEVDGISLTQEGTFDASIFEVDPITKMRIRETTGQSGFKMNEVDVDVVRLDDLDLQDVTAVKIDVQGFEHEVLLGGEKILTTQSPLLMIENNLKMEVIDQYLKTFGYSSYELSHDGLNLVPTIIPNVKLLNVFYKKPIISSFAQ